MTDAQANDIWNGLDSMQRAVFVVRFLGHFGEDALKRTSIPVRMKMMYDGDDSFKTYVDKLVVQHGTL
jgi:hypothetical protein